MSSTAGDWIGARGAWISPREGDAKSNWEKRTDPNTGESAAEAI